MLSSLTFAAFVSVSFAQSDPSLFNTVVTLPDDMPSITGSIELNTQLNVYPGGEITGFLDIGERYAPYSYNEVNIYGGLAGALLSKPGCRINLFDGTVHSIQSSSASGATVVCAGGRLGHLMIPGPTIIKGGLFGRISGNSESPLTLEGAEFELNSEPISTLTQRLSDEDVFTGVFADGTVFMFSPMHEDTVGGAGTTLVPVAIPPIDTTPIVLETGIGPRGLRPGQSLIVRGPATLPYHFSAHEADLIIENAVLPNDRTNTFMLVNSIQMNNGTLRATDSEIPFPIYSYGSQITLENSTDYGILAFKGSEVAIHGSAGSFAVIDSQSSLLFTDGFLGRATTISGQSTFEMTGGVIDQNFKVEDGSTANISGGQIGRNFNADSSTINITGGYIDRFFSPDYCTVTLSDGEIDAQFSPRSGEFIMTGGTLGSYPDFGSIFKITFTGGQIGNDIRFRYGDILISGGQFGYAFSMSGSAQVTVSGGSFGEWFQLDQSATLNLIGTEFLIDGITISALAHDVETTILDRDVTLSGVFQDGTPFSFQLNSAETVGEDFFNPTATLTITLVAPPCPADTNADGILDLGDINTFVNLFLASDLAADMNCDGILDLGDIQAFVAAFLAGC